VPSAPGKGRRQRLFFYFFEKTCAERPWQRPSAKVVFLFFEKTCAERPVAKAVGKDGFLFF
jgi:hypothetical protein